MKIDEDIPNILDLEDDEKLIHALHRTYLSVAITIIIAALGIFGFVMVYVLGYGVQFMFMMPSLVPIIFSVPFIILIVGIVLGVIIGKWYAGGHLFLITTKRILFYTKFVSKNLRELKFGKITDMVFTAGPFGRIFNYSNITLSTPGMEGGMGVTGAITFFFSIKGIKDGLQIRQEILDLIDAAEGAK